MPLTEQWPYLRFLGLSFWWAWRWLCFNSLELMQFYSEADRSVSVFYLYLFSTLSIGFTMLLAAVFWKKTTALIDNKGVIIGFGLFAAVATVLLGFSPLVGNAAFIFFAICTGLGTSFLCLKVGRVYGSVSLSESLTAGGLALVLAALLYFTGICVPLEGRLFFIGALPLLSALFLSMRSSDEIEGFGAVSALRSGIAGARGGTSTAKSFERTLIVRLTIASGVVALVAGIGKGLSSSFNGYEVFSQEGIKTIFAIMIIAVLFIVAINKQSVRRGVYQIYSGLMLMAVITALASLFDFSLAYLGVSKEPLWLILSCLMAYTAFRFDLSPIWVFGIGQAVYFLSSTAGWLIGFVFSRYYALDPIHDMVGIAIALLVLLILIYVFNGKDLSRITSFGVTRVGISEQANNRTVQAATELSEVQVSSMLSLSPSTQSKLGLSEREVEVMELFVQGRSASWIADTLFISANTVRSHIRAVYVKTGVHSRQELAEFLVVNNG